MWTDAVTWPLDEPWKPCPLDSAKSYAAFSFYLVVRDLRTVAEATARRLPTLERWAREAYWLTRAAALDKAAHDRAIEVARQGEVAEVTAELMTDPDPAPAVDQMDLLSDCFDVLRAAIDCHKDDLRRGLRIDMKLSEIVFCEEKLIKLHRLLRGESTENVAPALDYSKLSLDDLRTFRALLAKAAPS